MNCLLVLVSYGLLGNFYVRVCMMVLLVREVWVMSVYIYGSSVYCIVIVDLVVLIILFYLYGFWLIVFIVL